MSEDAADSALSPLYLFADSQLLFWKQEETLFLESLLQAVKHPEPKAAYLGASNGDAPEFYGIFQAAMENIGVRDCRLIHSALPAEDEAFLAEADIILLAGGDVEAGWKIFKQKGICELVLQRYNAGAILIGISAGAMQLGSYAPVERADSSIELLDTFKLLPFIIDAHDEKRDWQKLVGVVQLLEGTAKGIGIPSGGGFIYHPGGDIEAIRHPLYEFTFVADKLNRNLLIPEQAAAVSH